VHPTHASAGVASGSPLHQALESVGPALECFHRQAKLAHTAGRPFSEDAACLAPLHKALGANRTLANTLIRAVLALPPSQWGADPQLMVNLGGTSVHDHALQAVLVYGASNLGKG
jgi:hypothetical protein